MENAAKTEVVATHINRWLLSTGDLSQPQIRDMIGVNAFCCDKAISDIDMIFDINNKEVIIYTKLSFWKTLFRKAAVKARVKSKVKEILIQGVPNLNVRVIFDKSEFNNQLDYAKARGKGK